MVTIMVSCGTCRALSGGVLVYAATLPYDPAHVRLAVPVHIRHVMPGCCAVLPIPVYPCFQGLGMSLLVALSSWALWAGHNARCHIADTRCAATGLLLVWEQST